MFSQAQYRSLTEWSPKLQPQQNEVLMWVWYFRGRLGFYHSPNVAPSLGPVPGGALAERPGWPWIFWLLAMLSGLCLLVLFLFLPETARAIAGSGGYPTTDLALNVCTSWSRNKNCQRRGTMFRDRNDGISPTP